MSIRVSHITKLYGNQKALDDVSFEIHSGEVVGFLGPNGAGKSTMMKIITAFIPPSEGEVLVNGLSVLEDEDAVKRQIGYLPENNPLYYDMYVKEYLQFVAGLYVPANQRKEKISAMIARVGLEPEQHKKIGALSKGYKQRVGLAQALIHDPKVLILDEPTSGLDPNQIIEIRNLISSLSKEKTVMLSTHIMQEVEAICQRVIIIKNGKIVADNSPDAIARGTENQLITLQVEFDQKPVMKMLSSLAGIQEVKNLSDTRYLLHCSEFPDVRPLLFDFAVKNNLKVLNLQTINKSLEEAFHELTR